MILKFRKKRIYGAAVVLLLCCTLCVSVSPKPASAELLPESDDRYLIEADLYGMTPAMLRIARNEIFARHGYDFKSRDLQVYFSQFTWYYPYTRNVSLNRLEQGNVDFIKRYENSPRLQKNLRTYD